MTPETEATEPPAEQTDESVTEGEPVTEGEDKQVADLRREAAGYRRKLREAEKQRDELAEVVTTLRRAEVESLAATSLADSGDLWRSGAEVDQFLGDDGQVEATKVTAAIEALVEERPHYGKQVVSFDGGARTVVATPPDFAESLRRAASGG